MLRLTSSIIILLLIASASESIRLTKNDLKNMCIQAKRLLSTGLSLSGVVDRIENTLETKLREKMSRSGITDFVLSDNDQLMVRSVLGAMARGQAFSRGSTSSSTTDSASVSIKDDLKQMKDSVIAKSRLAATDNATINDAYSILLTNAVNSLKYSKSKMSAVFTDEESTPVAIAAEGGGATKNNEAKKTHHLSPDTEKVISSSHQSACSTYPYPDVIESDDKQKWILFVNNLLEQMS